MYLYLPAWLDLEKLFQAAVDSGRIKPIKRDHLHYILNLFIVVPSKNPSLLDEEGFLTLNGKLLQKYVRNYKQYLVFLLAAGIIIYCNRSGYKPGTMSKRYKLLRPENFNPTPIIAKVTDKVLLKKHAYFLKRKNGVKSLKYLTKWLEDGGLEIRYEEALTWDTQQMNQKLQTGDWDESTKNGKIIKKHPIEQSHYNRAVMQRIDHGDFYQSVDEKGCRLHTNLTSLSKGLRNFLMYNGQPLGTVDIKNSQPYLSLVLLNSDFWSALKMPFSGFWRGRNIERINKAPIKMLVESSQEADVQEVNRFVKLVTGGTLYETFAEELTSRLDREFLRKDAKLELLRVFFSDNRFFIQDAAKPKQIFKQMFPFVFSIYCLIKKGNKPLLAFLLQQIESHIVLHVICKRISKEFPHIPLFTIHDSVVTTIPHLGTVKRIMTEELERFVGHPPSLSEEAWEFLPICKAKQ